MSNLPVAVNQMAGETSPYLLQHKDNPVHWQIWGPAAFERARAEGKPVMLSIGYAACHWCHVMARESFEDAAVAAEINRLVVAIKVDREERPDIDHIYQSALAAMDRQGGWPLTMFLTPDGVPFWGGTYFAPNGGYGRPGFLDVLAQITASYRERPAVVANAAASLGRRLAALAGANRGGAITGEIADRIAARLVKAIDPEFGGLGDAPKFPHCAVFELLWRAWLRTSDVRYEKAVVDTLVRMSQGGIYDHLGGGFARYSTGSDWLVPHFEKMLYDNAQLIDLLTLVWQDTRTPLFADRVAESVAWLLREMVVADGAFAGTIDADSEHEEGRYYVWTADEVSAVLGAEADRFCAVYDVAPRGNWDGVTILNRRHALALCSPAEEAELRCLRARLLRARGGRVRPARDDKVLADWNALAIGALARAGLAFERGAWVLAAERAFARVCALLGTDDRLGQSWCAGRAGHIGMLEDYAGMTGAALALYEATGAAGYLARAEAWVRTVDRHFWDADRGGYFLTADDAEPTLIRPRTCFDGATPNGNALMVGALARLYHLTGGENYRERAEAVVAAFSGDLSDNIVGLATLVNQAELLERPVVVTLTGDGREALIRAVMAVSLPNRVLAPGLASAQGGGEAGQEAAGSPVASVCVDRTCGPPYRDAGELSAALARCRSVR